MSGTSEVFDDDDLREIERMIPPDLLNDVLTQNPINQVYFRAGLLACREYMARFVEQGGNEVIASSIRANWWPSLGEDPGTPRRYDYSELVEEYTKDDGTDGFRSRPLSPSVEALGRAYAFLASIASAQHEGHGETETGI